MSWRIRVFGGICLDASFPHVRVSNFPSLVPGPGITSVVLWAFNLLCSSVTSLLDRSRPCPLDTYPRCDRELSRGVLSFKSVPGIGQRAAPSPASPVCSLCSQIAIRESVSPHGAIPWEWDGGIGCCLWLEPSHHPELLVS